MTAEGTLTHMLGESSIAVIDPGPASDQHLAAILAAVPQGGRITHIFVTHAHLDHSALARPLAAATQAPILAAGPWDMGRSTLPDLGGGEGVDHGFIPDIALPNGAVVETEDWRITAHHSPGHMGNHMNVAWQDVEFCGDIVMDWSSTLISPPDGHLGAYLTSLAAIEARGPKRLLPAHGAAIANPRARCAELRAHRAMRHGQILSALTATPRSLSSLRAEIYPDLQPLLHPMAERNILAHLIGLIEENQAKPDSPLSAEAGFSRI
ncbi:MBL fold metallo-hydrolase [Roseobacter sp. HKCCA2468]|uniref:MBL fold metallo-hydrolase n=1 Tax=Roseobacter sp. HKCCA2468 TaxID=3120342 RepID=UPI0030EDA766